MLLDAIRDRLNKTQGTAIPALVGVHHGIHPFMDLISCMYDGRPFSLGACSTSSVIYAGLTVHGVLAIGATLLLARCVVAMGNDAQPVRVDA